MPKEDNLRSNHFNVSYTPWMHHSLEKYMGKQGYLKSVILCMDGYAGEDSNEG